MFAAIKQKIHDRPWLLVVFGLAVFVTLDIVFLVVAILHPQTPV